MSLEDAMRALNDPANQAINWALGNVLRARAARADWQQCLILRHLEMGAGNLNAWNELFRRTGEALADESALPRKAQMLLQPAGGSFDTVLDDFIAEMLAAQYLFLLQHGNIRFPVEQDDITTDLISEHDGVTYVTEAKNLREPTNLTYVAFAHWHRNRAVNPDRFNFRVEFVHLDDPFEDLTASQANAVRNLIDVLPDRTRPATFGITLPGNRSLRVRIGEGEAAMLRYGPGPFEVGPVVEECQRALLIKILEPAKKALTQLYSAAVPSESRRLLFIRWKPPDEVAVIGEAENIRTELQNALQILVRQFFPNFALVIVHTFEDPQNWRLAAWE
jgi:hypothetical protein